MRSVRPKFIYTIPTVQNPTGSILPEDRRRELLRLATAHDLPIVERHTGLERSLQVAWVGEQFAKMDVTQRPLRAVHRSRP